jgi:hypothetical protein
LGRAKNPLHFEKLTISFSQLNKKISSLEPYLKRVEFEDIKDRAPKKLFYCSKSIKPTPGADLRKTAVFTLSSKRAQKKHLFILQPGDYHAKK